MSRATGSAPSPGREPAGAGAGDDGAPLAALPRRRAGARTSRAAAERAASTRSLARYASSPAREQLGRRSRPPAHPSEALPPCRSPAADRSAGSPYGAAPQPVISNVASSFTASLRGRSIVLARTSATRVASAQLPALATTGARRPWTGVGDRGSGHARPRSLGARSASSVARRSALTYWATRASRSGATHPLASGSRVAGRRHRVADPQRGWTSLPPACQAACALAPIARAQSRSPRHRRRRRFAVAAETVRAGHSARAPTRTRGVRRRSSRSRARRWSPRAPGIRRARTATPVLRLTRRARSSGDRAPCGASCHVDVERDSRAVTQEPRPPDGRTWTVVAQSAGIGGDVPSPVARLAGRSAAPAGSASVASLAASAAGVSSASSARRPRSRIASSSDQRTWLRSPPPDEPGDASSPTATRPFAVMRGVPCAPRTPPPGSEPRRASPRSSARCSRTRRWSGSTRARRAARECPSARSSGCSAATSG